MVGAWPSRYIPSQRTRLVDAVASRSVQIQGEWDQAQKAQAAPQEGTGEKEEVTYAQGLYTLCASSGAGRGGVRFPEPISQQQTTDGNADRPGSWAIRDELSPGDACPDFARSRPTCSTRPLGGWDPTGRIYHWRHWL